MLTHYLLLAAVVFGVNLLPAFGPPTWAVLVFLRLRWHLELVPTVLIGAAAAASGRLLLALGARLFRHRLSTRRRRHLAALRSVFVKNRTRSIAGLGLFALSPVPSAQLFESAGLMDVPLVPLTVAFFAGRLVSYTIYVAAAASAEKGLSEILRKGVTSPVAIAFEVVMIAGLVLLLRVDWTRLITRARRRRAARKRSAAGLVLAAAVTFAVVSDSSAGDPPPAPKPKARKSVATLPAQFVKPQPKVEDLKIGEAARVFHNEIWFTPDGAGWLNPAASLTMPEDAGGFVMPTVRRTGDKDYDLDLTGCDSVWGFVQSDGSTFTPAPRHIRVHRFWNANDEPTDVLPPRFRGAPLWSLPPATAAFVSARCIGVNSRGESWIRAAWPVRTERFTDSAGPAVALTTSDRDVVKLDLTGVTFRWSPDDFPRVRELKDAAGLNGHKADPFGVTSFTVGGRVSTTMPSEFLVPQLKYLKPGESGFVDVGFICVDPNCGAWIDPDAAVRPTQEKDGWGFAFVSVKRTDATTCILDLAGTTFLWCVSDTVGHRFPAVMESGNTAFGQTWLKAAEITEGDKSLGPFLPQRSRGERIWEVPAGTVVYASARFLGIDKTLHGFIGAPTPVSREPFTDDVGPAVAITLKAEDACTVDVSAATFQWEFIPTPELGLVASPLPGGPHFKCLRVDAFLVVDDAPPAPPPKPKKGK